MKKVAVTLVAITFLCGCSFVPNVKGQPIALAVEAITNADFTMGDVKPASSETVETGKVVRQWPWPIIPVARGSIVTIYVSNGPPVVVPNVVGKTREYAFSAILTAGLTISTITEQNSTTVQAGKIISQNPSAGTKIRKGNSIALVISKG